MNTKGKTWPQLVWIGLLSVSAIACADSATAPAEDTELEEIVLPLRVHLLRSSRIASLNAPLTVEQAQTLVRDVSEVWAQGGIRWTVEGLVEEEAAVTANVVSAFNGATAVDFPVLLEAVGGDPRAAGWDVYLVRDFGNAGFAGVYFSGTGMLFAKLADQNGVIDLADFGTRVLSHELGHSLSLQHVACPPAGNLMAPGCPGEVRTRLTDVQVSAARTQAQRGRPF